ncbi:hypothetical protein AXF42_Ash008513 [Apostasia shenzhenica]|uniref:Iron-binding zinc finger CDGSH type domain-containing protein n=1 Tax=Apostasia shenzhenica TaxID=1088818 RepID=A0A2I0AY26_9ASPA|nr:hypothetical protein AXF42_Ash008513 [Apostasia shenzhenica]
MASYSAVVSTIGACFTYGPTAETLQKRQLNAPAPRRRGVSVVVRAEGGINPEIRKNEDKVVDSVVVSELSKPLTAYCRCWRSGAFPLCDGSHAKHNKATGDNVGPLLVKK